MPTPTLITNADLRASPKKRALASQLTRALFSVAQGRGMRTGPDCPKGEEWNFTAALQ